MKETIIPYIILYIIEVALKHDGCVKWLHQIVNF